MKMDERLSAVREELEAGSVSPHSLVLLFNSASEADHAGDLTTLEQTLDLARAITEAAGETLRAETERLATICEQSLASVRQRQLGATGKPADGMIAYELSFGPGIRSPAREECGGLPRGVGD